jgi:hypothetical protein
VEKTFEYGIAYLARLDAGKLTGLISFSGNSSMAKGGYQTSGQCLRNDMLHRVTQANYQREQRCSWVNHITQMNSAGDKEIAKKAALEALRAKNVKLPDVALTVGFRFASATKHEVLNYFFFPELDGAPVVADSPWVQSDWHRDRYQSDPNKVAYVEKLKKILSELEPKAFAAF